jgi:hypothetical protein
MSKLVSGIGILGDVSMIVDRAWVKRNLGFDPLTEPPPLDTFAFKTAATSTDTADLQREIIDFDSEAMPGLDSSRLRPRRGYRGLRTSPGLQA